MKCRDCEFLKVDRPDAMNEGSAYCSKYDVSTMLIGKNYEKKLNNLECYGDEEKAKEKRDKDEFILHIMNGYDTIEAPNGETCFGCYINSEYEAYVAGNMPTDQLFHTIAHEYMHYLQDIEGRDSDEKEANDFGYSVFIPVYQQGKKDAIDEFVEKANEEVYKDFSFADVGEYSIKDVALTLYRVAEQLKEKVDV